MLWGLIKFASSPVFSSSACSTNRSLLSTMGCSYTCCFALWSFPTIHKVGNEWLVILIKLFNTAVNDVDADKSAHYRWVLIVTNLIEKNVLIYPYSTSFPKV